MRKIAAVGLFGLSSLLTPSLANASEDFFKPIELSEEDRINLIAQAAEDQSFDEQADDKPIKRADGFYFPLSIGGQQFSGYDVETTVNGRDANGKTSFGLGPSGETGLGYKFGNFRSEVLYGYSNMPGEDFSLSHKYKATNEKSEDSNMQTLTLGLLYDIDTKSKWTPYFGGQLGVGWFTLGEQSFKVGNRKYSTEKQTQSAFVYGGKVGLTYQASRQWDLFVEGGYLRNNSYDFDVNVKSKTTTTTVRNSEIAVDELDRIYDPSLPYTIMNTDGGITTIYCGQDFGPTGAGAPARCFREKEVDFDITDSTVVSSSVLNSKVSDMYFGPGNGWSLRAGFRWFFNQPKAKPVAVVSDPEPEVKEEPVPVRGLW
jgi:opacity protein-like surface antigen